MMQDSSVPLDPIQILDEHGESYRGRVLLVFRTFQSNHLFGSTEPTIGYVREYKAGDPIPTVAYGYGSNGITLDGYFILSAGNVPAWCGMRGDVDGWDAGKWVLLSAKSRTHRLRPITNEQEVILRERLIMPIIRSDPYVVPGGLFADDPLCQWLHWTGSKVAINLTDQERSLVKQYFDATHTDAPPSAPK